MNKTLSIGLAGFSFIIEEHAYIKLSDYLAALKSSLDANEAEEVMHDIEIRMVEIFNDTLGKREVINVSDVEKVISQIGQPEQIEEQEQAYYSENANKAKSTAGNRTYNKQLFRDPEKQKIAGVCAGLAHYIGMDITAMRAIWLGIAILGVFTAAISTTLIIVIYGILWIVLPKAETATDFLKMQGKPMNFDNLKNESNKIVQFANESTQRVGEIYTENKPYINSAGNGLWNILKYVIGAFLAIMAVSSIIGVFVVFGMFGVDSNFPGANYMKFYFDDKNLYGVLSALIIIGALIPAIIFSVLSIKIFSPKTKLRNVGWVLAALVIGSMGLGAYFGVSMAKDQAFLKGQKDDVENLAINTISDSLYLDTYQVTIPQNFTAYDDDLYSDKKMVFEADFPAVDVTRNANIDAPYLIIKKEGKGYNVPVQLKVPVRIENNKILLPNFVQYPYDQRFRNYNVNYELVVPQRTKIFQTREDVLQLEGDLDGNGIQDDYEDNADGSNSITIGKNRVRINGNSIKYNPNDKDSIIINGKKMPKADGNKFMDSVKNNMGKVNDVDISINSRKKEISIKTN
jgi:phage shock protein PspC (stress-responsive transcriptional regulator)